MLKNWIPTKQKVTSIREKKTWVLSFKWRRSTLWSEPGQFPVDVIRFCCVGRVIPFCIKTRKMREVTKSWNILETEKSFFFLQPYKHQEFCGRLKKRIKTNREVTRTREQSRVSSFTWIRFTFWAEPGKFPAVIIRYCCVGRIISFRISRLEKWKNLLNHETSWKQ